MLRKRFLAIAVLCGALPGAVFGLGLGEIRGGSYLNEPFRAEIELVGVKPEELDAIAVKLAPDEEFRKAGALRASTLNQLKFQPRAAPSGRLIISVTSDEAIREPFVEFLVEVNWPQGRLVKEYTLLLDPPVTLPGIGAPRRLPAMLPTRPQAASGLRLSPTSPISPTSVPLVSPDGSGSLTYGPVRRGEHLWGIAKRLEVPGASHQEILKALFRANPEAFLRRDINKLKAGALLRLGPAEAGEAAEPVSTDSRPPGTLGSDRGEGAGSTRPPEGTPHDRLRIAPSTPVAGTAEPGAVTVGAEALGTVRRDLSLVREETETVRQETSQLQQRVQGLEGQLKDIHHLLEIRNAQISQLQRELLGSGTQPDQGTAVAQTADGNPSPDPGTSTAGVGESKTSTNPAPNPSLPEPPLALPPDSGWLAALEDTAAVPATVAAVATLLLLVTYGMRRRHGGHPKEVLARDTPAQAPRSSSPAPAEAFPTLPLPPPAETQASSDDTFSAPLQAMPGEGTVLEEANLMLKSGRHRQAEQLVRGLLAKEPYRLDLKVKLAEIYHRAQDLSGFANLLRELENSHNGPLPEETTDQLSAMAADLGLRPKSIPSAPESPLPFPASVFLAQPSGPLATPSEPTKPPVISEPTLASLLHPSVNPDATPHQAGVPKPALDLDLDLDAVLAEIEQMDQLAQAQAESFGALPDLTPDFFEPPPGEPSARDAAPLAAAVLNAKIPEMDQGTRETPGLSRSDEEERQQVLSVEKNALKLDLARAYRAMDDNDSARAMLEELLADADGVVKEEAELLLASLDERPEGHSGLDDAPTAIGDSEFKPLGTDSPHPRP